MLEDGANKGLILAAITCKVTAVFCVVLPMLTSSFFLKERNGKVCTMPCIIEEIVKFESQAVLCINDHLHFARLFQRSLAGR